MPELRNDPVTGRWVLISTERSRRPSDFISIPQKSHAGLCPLCEGSEASMPPEVYALREAGGLENSGGWGVRVIPHKIPALQLQGEIERRADGLYDCVNGIGAHELIIETPRHELSMAALDEKELYAVINAYCARINELKKDKRFKYVLVFKNCGQEAGAIYDHTHSQLLALPTVPFLVKAELQGARRYYEWKERCVFCDIVLQEIRDKSRLIYENEEFIAFCPYAPRAPYEIWIAPKKHSAHFEKTGAQERKLLAKCMRDALLRQHILLSAPSYNFVLHNAPFDETETPFYHWHIEIIPRLGNFAGFEMGSGFYINPTPPEAAAKDFLGVEIL